MNNRPTVRVGGTTAAVLAGNDDVTTWDMEELRAGKRRNKNGTFAGPDPAVVPAAVLKELARRVRSQEEVMLIVAGHRALQVLEEIMMDHNQDGSARVKAATVMLERARGKVPQGIAVMQPPEPMSPMERLARSTVVTTTGRPLADEEPLPQVGRGMVRIDRSGFEEPDDQPMPTVGRGIVIDDRSGFAEEDGDG
jgi:hypothetical protein